MPVANKYDLSEVLDACDYYFDKTGRRITFEYSLVHGVNDTPEDAKELMGILKDRNCHLNLIPVNPIKERNYEKPDKKSAENFKNKLEKKRDKCYYKKRNGLRYRRSLWTVTAQDDARSIKYENIFYDRCWKKT